MSILKRNFDFDFSPAFLFCTALLLAGAWEGAAAQANPQLLPYAVTAVAGGGVYGSAAATASTSGFYSKGYYNYSGGNTSCAYWAWSSASGAYAATVDSKHTPTDTVGDGCLATELALSSTATSPSTERSAVADSEGNLFFIDSVNNLIRRVDAHTGVVTTVGGATTATTTSTTSTGAPAFSSLATANACSAQTDAYGDGCLATQVPMADPQALTLDAQGNIWFTDYYLGAVREIVKSTGIIETVVNQSVSINPGLSPAISGDTFTWSKGTGYVGYNATNLASATYGNVGGAGGSGGIGSQCAAVSATCYVTAAQALLFRPYALAFDTAGNLYIAENYNNLVDVVNLSNTTRTIAGYTVYPQEILTIAGTGCPARWDTYTQGENLPASGSATPTNPAQATMSCDSSTYYGHSNGSSPYPSTGSTLDSPYQVAVDNSGNIYIADEYPYDVRVIAGEANYALPGGTALTNAGDIGTFAGVLNSGRSTATALSRGVANSTNLGDVYGVAADSLGDVYISDYDATTSSTTMSDYIERVDIATGELYAVAGEETSNEGTTALPGYAGIAPGGASYCTSPTDDVGDGCPALKATFWKSYFASVDAVGNLYVGDAGNGLIRKLSVGTQFPPTAVGTPVTQTLEIHFGANDTPSATVSPYALPSGITEFTLGTASCGTKNSDNTMDCTLAVTFTPAQAGVRTAALTVTGTSGKVSVFALTGSGLAPVLAVDPGTQAAVASSGVTAVNAIALDDAGNVYAAVPGASSIVVTSSGGTQSNIGAGLSGANAVAVDAAGNVYAALSSGTVVEVPGNRGSQVTIGSGFSDPAGIAVDAYGNVYVADENASSVTEIMAGTGVEVVLANQTTVPALDKPTGVAVDSYGNVFVSSTVGNSVIELPFNGSAAVTLGTGLDAPLGLAVDPAGSLYVADSGNKRIVFIPNESGTLNSSDQIAVISSGLTTPTGVAVAGNGTLYVSDSYANAIYSVARSAASIAFSPEIIAQGTAPAGSATAKVDIISMGTLPAAFATPFTSESGADSYNTGSFTLTPTTINGAPEFPNAGYGAELTASFAPAKAEALHATFTFDSTSPSTQPTLTVSGTGTNPAYTTTTSIASTVPKGQASWIYGQTVAVTVTVTPTNLNWELTPTGTISVTVDGVPYTGTIATSTSNYSLTGTLNLVGLNAGPHTINATCSSDSNFAQSTANPFPMSLATAPLTITGATISKPFDAPLPTLTGTVSGAQNGDVIGVSYSTTAVWNSPVIAGGYAIVPSVGALSNYTAKLNNGTLNVTQDSTVVSLGSSATSVNSTTQVTLTATVANQTVYAGGTAPTGYVAFFNTVGGTATQIGSNAQIVSGVATLQTTFAVASGQPSTSNNVTAQYLGDQNFVTSTSAPVGITSGVPTFALAQSPNASLTIEPGQSGMLSFTMAPAFGYNGTIAFSCSGLPAGASCAFSPASIVADGKNTSSLVTLTVNTQQPQSPVSMNERSGGLFGGIPRSLALIPGVLLLCGFGARRRKLLRAARLLIMAALCLAGLGLSACGGRASIAGTPAGTDSITVVASGTGGSFASVSQQFTVTLQVQ